MYTLLPWWQCFLGSILCCLNSDCLPVTLSEVEDLLTETFLVGFPAHSDGGIPQAHPLRAFTRFCTDPQVVYTQHRVCSTRWDKVHLWSLNHTLNLMLLIVSFRSSHPSLFDWNAWSLRTLFNGLVARQPTSTHRHGASTATPPTMHTTITGHSQLRKGPKHPD